MTFTNVMWDRPPMFSERELRDSTTLFVGNLSYHMRERDLADYFSKCGRLRNVTVGINKRTGQSKGYGFVEFEHRRDAEDAYERFNGYNIDGRRLRVDWDVGLDRKQNFFGGRGRSPPRRRSPSPRGRSPRRSPRRSRSPARARHSPSPSKSPRSPAKRSPSPRDRSPHASNKERSPARKRSRSPPRSPSPAAEKRQKVEGDQDQQPDRHSGSP